jgi:hypothetical protein
MYSRVELSFEIHNRLRRYLLCDIFNLIANTSLTKDYIYKGMERNKVVKCKNIDVLHNICPKRVNKKMPIRMQGQFIFHEKLNHLKRCSKHAKIEDEVLIKIFVEIQYSG